MATESTAGLPDGTVSLAQAPVAGAAPAAPNMRVLAQKYYDAQAADAARKDGLFTATAAVLNEYPQLRGVFGEPNHRGA